MPEPPSKRKTLAERAGETQPPSRSHLPKTGFPGSRVNSYRNPSNTSTSSSGSSIRPTNRGTGLRQAARQQAAAVEAPMESEEEAEAGVMGTRKGTPIISFAPSGRDNITLRKTRTHGGLRQHHTSGDHRLQHSGSHANGCGSRGGSLQEQKLLSRESSLMRKGESTTGQNPRNISLSTAFTALSLHPDPERKTSGKRLPPSFECIKGEDSPSKIPQCAHTPSLRHTQSAQTLQTPSPLKQKPSERDFRTPFTSVKRKKDPLPVFLTKETLTSFPAWDTKGRLEDMVSRGTRDQDREHANDRQESLYAMLRTQFASAADSKTALEESLSIYKSRGQHPARVRKLNFN